MAPGSVLQFPGQLALVAELALWGEEERERVALLRTTFFRYNVLRAEPVTRGSTRGRGPASAHDAGSSPA